MDHVEAVTLSLKHAPFCLLHGFALPCELAFWALWHCRHARPPDAFSVA